MLDKLSPRIQAALSIGAFAISLLAMLVSYMYRHGVDYSAVTAGISLPGAGTEDVEKALKEKPEMIMEAIALMQQREAEKRSVQQKEGIKGSTKELFQHETNPIGGNVNGDITIVEFFDYRCGFCRRVFGSVKDALSSDGKVKVVYKEFPIMGDTKLAQATLAAHKQGKYYAFHQALMNSKGSLNEKELDSIAKTLKLDIKKWKADMQADDVKKQIQENLDLGHKLGIQVTPTFVVGEAVIPGAVDAEYLKNTFAEERKKTKTAA